MTKYAPANAGKNNKNDLCNTVNIGKIASGTILPKRTDILISAKPLPPGLGAKYIMNCIKI